MFGVYKGDFMQEPSSETLAADLDSTFLSFLKKYNLEAMKIFLQISNELQGYGYLNEVSALYGLIWNKPKFMFGYLLRSLESDPVIQEALKTSAGLFCQHSILHQIGDLVRNKFQLSNGRKKSGAHEFITYQLDPWFK